MKIFVDTNILLDVPACRQPFYASAARIWTLAEHGHVAAHVSALSFNNIYYIIRKAENKEKARTALHLLRDVFIPVAPDRQLMDQAIDSDMDDFEDAIQYYSADRIHAEYLITRNPKDFPSDGIPVIAPAEFLTLREGPAKPQVRQSGQTP